MVQISSGEKGMRKCCTEIRRHYPGMQGNIQRVLARVLYKSPNEGCQTILYCALADGLRDFSGKMFTNCKVVKTKDFARDQALGRKLWNLSLTLTGLDHEFLMYAEHEEEDTSQSASAENGTQDLSGGTKGMATTTTGMGGEAASAEDVTGPEKRASVAAGSMPPTQTSQKS
ncbi:hypothetical protein ACOMHN_056700 [Nucella lapillus]